MDLHAIAWGLAAVPWWVRAAMGSVILAGAVVGMFLTWREL